MSKWRETYKVHPAADVFPMMSDEELDALGEDIKANGLKNQIVLWDGGNGTDWLIDGRNRLEAMERAGVRHPKHSYHLDESSGLSDSPVAAIVALNIHRRHMLKSERADAIVALAKLSANKPDHADPVSKGGRGKKNAVKAKALEINAIMPPEHQVSEPTIKRAIAKAEGKVPKPKKKPRVEEPIGGEVGTPKPKARQPHYSARPMPKPRSGKTLAGLEAARRYYLDLCADPDVDLDAEQEVIVDALREIAGRRP